MDRAGFNAFCATLPGAQHVVQWGNSDVWKVGGKLFAVCGWAGENGDKDAFTFKVSDIAWEVLRDQPGIRPAPYLASRGLKWLQHYKSPGLSDNELEIHIRASYEMVRAALPKKTKAALGLPDGA